MDFGIEGMRGGTGAPPAVSAANLVVLGILTAIVGRIFLACLPAGLPGRHAPRDLPATWAASHLVGLTWFLAIGELAEGSAWISVAFGVPLLALAVLLLTSPAGLVPRHEPIPLRGGLVVRATIVVTVLATGTWSVLGIGSKGSVYLAFTTCAAAILAHEALALARVQPWVRAATLAAICAGLAFLPHSGGPDEWWAVIGAGGIAAGIVGWIRRGDRRALAIAGIGLAFLPLSDSGAPMAGLLLVVPVATIIATARPSRARVLTWLLGGAIAGTAVLDFGGRLLPPVYVSRTALGVGVELVLVGLVVFTLCTTYVLRKRRVSPTWNVSGAPESREARVLGYSAITAILITEWMSWHAADDFAHFGYENSSPFTASAWILLLIAVAIPLARTLERTRTT